MKLTALSLAIAAALAAQIGAAMPVSAHRAPRPVVSCVMTHYPNGTSLITCHAPRSR